MTSKEDYDQVEWTNPSLLWETPLEKLPLPPQGLLDRTTNLPALLSPGNNIYIPNHILKLPCPTLGLVEDEDLPPEHGADPCSLIEQMKLEETPLTRTNIKPCTSTPPRTSTSFSSVISSSPYSADSSTSNRSRKPSSEALAKDDLQGQDVSEKQSTAEGCTYEYERGVYGPKLQDGSASVHLLRGQILEGRKGNRRWRRNMWVIEKSITYRSNEADRLDEGDQTWSEESVGTGS